jgi:hypothetical protein
MPIMAETKFYLIMIIISVNHLTSSKTFEEKVEKLINDHLDDYDYEKAKDIFISGAGMRIAKGYGQFKKFVYIRIDSNDLTLTDHSTDSQLFDFLNHSEDMNKTHSDALKALILDVIENNLEKLEVTEEKE